MQYVNYYTVLCLQYLYKTTLLGHCPFAMYALRFKFEIQCSTDMSSMLQHHEY